MKTIGGKEEKSRQGHFLREARRWYCKVRINKLCKFQLNSWARKLSTKHGQNNGNDRQCSQSTQVQGEGNCSVLLFCFVFAEFQWQQRISPKRESKVINKGLIDETIAFPLRQHRSTVCVVCCAQSLNRVRLFATLRTGAHQAPLSMGFSRQEYWRGLPCPLPRDLPNPGIEPRSPKLQADSLPSEPPGKPTVCHRGYKTTRIPCAKIKLKKKIR